MKTPSAPKPCRVCGLSVIRGTSGLSTRVHWWCKEEAKPKQERAKPAYKLTRAVSRHGTTNPNMDIAKGNHRDRKLLDLAHEVRVCTNCFEFAPQGCEPAHANAGITASKGLSIKASDGEHAALCHACHLFLDSGANGLDPSGRFQATREDKCEMWLAAHFKTMAIYWRNGWIKVAA